MSPVYTFFEMMNNNPNYIPVSEEKVKQATFLLNFARFFTLMPAIYLCLEIGYCFLPGAMVDLGDQHYIFFIGSWFYVFLSFPYVIGFGVFKSRLALAYGIVINLLFLLHAAFWALEMLVIKEPITPAHYCPSLFGLRANVLRYVYVAFYLLTTTVSIAAWIPTSFLKRVIKFPCN